MALFGIYAQKAVIMARLTREEEFHIHNSLQAKPFVATQHITASVT